LRPMCCSARSRRRRLLSALSFTEPIWKEEDHPEFASGADAWVRRLRQEGESRVPGPKSPEPE
jgi:hypothetical protein